jgi:hypothetical protein
MTISSLFASQERLFAQYLVNTSFNDEIHAEYRCPGADQDQLLDAYFTPAESDKEIQELESEELKRRRVVHFTSLARRQPLPREELKAAEEQQVESKEKVFQLVHGPVVDRVEKTAHPVSVDYGNFWGQSRFQITNKSTGYYLLEGWLVVSIPESQKEDPLELKDGSETTTVVYKFDGAQDPVSNKISGYVQSWFDRQSEKLWSAFTASVVGSALFSLTVIALGHTDHFAGQLFSRTLVIGAVAMLAMVLYLGVRLYKLHLFKEKMLFIDNLGCWVQQVRLSIGDYPELCIGAPHIDKFFSPKNQRVIRDIRADTTIKV